MQEKQGNVHSIPFLFFFDFCSKTLHKEPLGLAKFKHRNTNKLWDAFHGAKRNLRQFILYLESKQILLEIKRGLEKVVIAKACNFITKETLPQVFSCEFCEISKNIFFHRNPWWLLL